VKRAPLLSSRGLILRAAIVALAFALAHVLGLRSYTSILSGTSPTGDPSDAWAVLLGFSYVVLYFAFVLAVPIALIAAALMAVGERVWRSPPR
jgi:hypothetical protein